MGYVHADDWTEQLRGTFETGVRRLRKTMPLSLASVVAQQSDGTLEILARQADVRLQSLLESNLPVAPAAFDWLEVNRQLLVLSLGGQPRRSDLYRPMVALGLESAVIAPLVAERRLRGALIVASRWSVSFTPDEIAQVRLLSGELAELLRVRYAPGGRAAPEVSLQAEEPVRPAAAEAKMAPEPAMAGLAVVRADELGRIQSWDQRAEELFGWRAQEVIGRFLALLVRDKSGKVLDIRMREKLLANGCFAGRTVSWRRDGVPVICHVELQAVQAEGGARGFIGHIRSVPSSTLLPHEPIELGFAELYAFSNPLKRGPRAGGC